MLVKVTVGGKPVLHNLGSDRPVYGLNGDLGLEIAQLPLGQ